MSYLFKQTLFFMAITKLVEVFISNSCSLAVTFLNTKYYEDYT